MIELRGHHLLCSVTFSGRGYSREFERDFREILKRMNDGELIRLVKGPDALCRSVKDAADSHCHECRIGKRDELALTDLSRFLGRKLSIGDEVSPGELYSRSMKQAYKHSEIRSACFDCQWKDLCDDIAENEFNNSMLFNIKDGDEQ